MGTASRSGSTGRRAALTTALIAVVLVPSAAAGLRLEAFRGHLAVGYGRLIQEDAPGGSLAFSGGVDYPVGGRLRAGVDVGYLLLGTRILERGSQGAELDYSVFEALALAHWTPARGPVGIVSIGPGLFHARADLTSSAPAAFSDLAVGETVAGLALGLTVIPRRPAPVRAGFELGLRSLWLPDDTWTVVAGGLTIHY